MFRQARYSLILYTHTRLHVNRLTTGAGCFLNGSAISSYTVRWNGSNTPAVATAIEELHWDNYTIAETVNIGTGKIELTIGHPTGMATQTWTNTQLSLKANDADQAHFSGCIFW